ncbi:MAG: tetratricopeptide repeat protein [Sphingomonadaceae bacterium]|nr:tetratricopeptide repeat protein [Sphingomonadaceae bacterium]
MKTSWAKLACSSLVLGTLAIGCTPTANLHPDTLASSGPKATKLAARSAAQAKAYLAAHKPAKAIAPAETAVAAAPENVGYRVLLGQAYLQAGRFASAETALGQALTLDPASPSAGLNLALAQVAEGKQTDARATLQQVREGIAPADLGLALALAGAREDAVNTLAGVARSPQSTPKVRQNLAFALALAGRWKEARAVAAQDLAPNDVDARLKQWATLAEPKSANDQVASVLGVHPAADPGEPTMLALAQPATSTAVAAADPAPLAAPVQARDTAPVASVAAADPAPAPAAAPTIVADATPAGGGSPAVSYFYPGEDDVTHFVTPTGNPRVSSSKPMVTADEATPRVSLRKPVAVAASTPKTPKLLARREAPKAWPHAAGGDFVVQLGAYSRSDAVQAAWATDGHYLQAAAFTPSSATYAGPRHRQLYRLSIAGFKSHDEAFDVCLRIRAKGGRCFVRAAQGDQLAAWFKGGSALALRGPVPKPLPAPAQKIAQRALPVKPVSAQAGPRNKGIVIALK